MQIGLFNCRFNTLFLLWLAAGTDTVFLYVHKAWCGDFLPAPGLSMWHVVKTTRIMKRKMSMKKKDMLWYVGLGMFALFALLALTGLINWLVLPRGYGTGQSFLLSLRHFLRDVHEWAGFFFIILAGIHLWLHKDYIVNNWKKTFGKKS